MIIPKYKRFAVQKHYLEINGEIIDRVASFLYLRNLQKSNSHVVFDTWSPRGKGVGKFKKSQRSEKATKVSVTDN